MFWSRGTRVNCVGVSLNGPINDGFLIGGGVGGTNIPPPFLAFLLTLRETRVVGLSVNTGLSTCMIFGEKWTTLAIGLLVMGCCDVERDGAVEDIDMWLGKDDGGCGFCSVGDFSVSLISAFIVSVKGAIVAFADVDVAGVFFSLLMTSSLLLFFGDVKGDGGSLVETTSIVSASSSSSSSSLWYSS